MLASTYSTLELLVVDDRSSDATRSIVEELAASDARVRLIEGAPLPPGWFGKPWACAQGAAAATGDMLLFTDADTRHTPALLGHAVAALAAKHGDLVTIAPRQLCVGFWERVVMPQIWLLLGLRYHPGSVNRAQRGRDVIANGQFILTTRQAYEAVGGHAAVRGEVAEDLALAQRYHASGRKVWFAFAERLMETRMYHGLSHLVEGWSKNIHLGGQRSFPDEPLLRALAPLMLATWFLFWLVPPVALALSLAWPALREAALWACGLSAGFWVAMAAGMRIPPWYGLAWPLGAAVALYISIRSARRGAARVEWKGRVYGGGSAAPEG